MRMLEGKVVAITGAGRGIGRAIALLCAREGAHVVVNDFGGSASGEGADASPAHEVVEEIRAAGGEAIANLADICNPQQAESIVGDAVQRFGRIDAVVNNAGFLRDRIFHKMSTVDWQQVVDVHLNGYFHVAKAASLHFREQGGGAYVHLTSTSGLVGNYGQANYAAAKMGVIGLSNSIALDMQRYGVRSNCIAPFAWSRLMATIPAETEAERLRVERAKTMTPDKVAPLAAYLCSDRARDVSGQIFCVRKNEIFLFSPPRPVSSACKVEGWTPQSIADELIPSFRTSMLPLQRSSDVFWWDPM